MVAVHSVLRIILRTLVIFPGQKGEHIHPSNLYTTYFSVCAGVRFPSGVLPGTVGIVPACCYDKEDKNLDDFREWLSDNLRYFMLGGAILVIVLVLIFGVRACVGGKKGNSNKDQTTAQSNQENDPSSPEMMGRQTRRKTPVPRQIRMRRQPWKKPARK